MLGNIPGLVQEVVLLEWEEQASLVIGGIRDPSPPKMPTA